MVDLLVGTDSPETSETLADYLRDVTTAEDLLHVVNSQVGGDDTTTDAVRAGEEAIDRLVEQLEDHVVPVETHQLVRGNEPAEDLLEFAATEDVDELVVGVHKRTPVGKVVFGSTAQALLLHADRPVRCIPLTEA